MPAFLMASASGGSSLGREQLQRKSRSYSRGSGDGNPGDTSRGGRSDLLFWDASSCAITLILLTASCTNAQTQVKGPKTSISDMAMPRYCGVAPVFEHRAQLAHVARRLLMVLHGLHLLRRQRRKRLHDHPRHVPQPSIAAWQITA